MASNLRQQGLHCIIAAQGPASKQVAGRQGSPRQAAVPAPLKLKLPRLHKLMTNRICRISTSSAWLAGPGVVLVLSGSARPSEAAARRGSCSQSILSLCSGGSETRQLGSGCAQAARRPGSWAQAVLRRR